ncbi:MAG: DUF4136 domain-containing protein [Acidobacteria bacterium Pan2503]|uniref:DUF4136 domain-containing protein n=1 Tax=Candidatus Acidiferrum panamense TaxID=2741543 RepID=A0A7V8NMZ7_9BACT|nr:DUF4136 domain-containing protein [Candidatus Acidoferrum panamensis]
MTHWTNRKSSLIAVAALLSGLLLAGCDEYVQITRDPDVPIHKLATWAWRPAAEQANARDSRAVISRDMISRDETVVRDSDADNEMVRQRVKTAIEQTLASKGLTRISDAQAADFLVDYQFAVERRNATVPAAYEGYPGVVCGPYGCWQSWGWGPAAVGYQNIRFRQGTIVFDFIQRSTKHLVYRGVGEKPVHYNTFTLTQGDIHALVHRLLEDLRTQK